MGNKHGKFTVAGEDVKESPKAETDVVEGHIEDHQEIATEKTEDVKTEESQPEQKPKKRCVMKWFKKVSIRKEKKPKAAKQNGMKEEVVEDMKENADVKENGDIKENVEVEQVNEVKNDIPEEVAVSNGHCAEEKVDTSTEKKKIDEELSESNEKNDNPVEEIVAESQTTEEQH